MFPDFYKKFILFFSFLYILDPSLGFSEDNDLPIDYFQGVEIEDSIDDSGIEGFGEMKEELQIETSNSRGNNSINKRKEDIRKRRLLRKREILFDLKAPHRVHFFVPLYFQLFKQIKVEGTSLESSSPKGIGIFFTTNSRLEITFTKFDVFLSEKAEIGQQNRQKYLTETVSLGVFYPRVFNQIIWDKLSIGLGAAIAESVIRCDNDLCGNREFSPTYSL